MSMPSKLVNQSGSTDEGTKVKVTQKEIMEIGGKCYGMALNLQKDCAALWHDLGVNYFCQSKIADKGRTKMLVGKSLQSLQTAVRTDPTNHKHWDVLGVVAATSDVNHPALAQHCFIKSVECEATNVSAWTNLGALYLRHGDVKQAHEAFKVAQSLEPSYVACWIGQALIAETVGDAEAMDLFRHTTELAPHVEGAVGYGHWVCRLLLETDGRKNTAAFDYAIHQMAAVPAASDALAKYTDRVHDDPVAYNLYGLLLERQSLYKVASDALRKAVSLLENTGSSEVVGVRVNLARVLCAAGEHEESVAQYKLLPKMENPDVVCGYALALYKSAQYTESVAAYEQALALTKLEADKSHIHAVIGIVSYRSGDVARAKAALFEGFQLGTPSVLGLEALLSIGLLQKDATLATAVLDEFQKLGDLGPQLTARIDSLASDVSALGAPLDVVKRALQRSVHKNPDNPKLWAKLGDFLVKNNLERFLAARSCARKVEVLTNDDMFATALLRSVGELGAGLHSPTDRNNNAISSAQKAVHLKPDSTEAWFTLLAALFAKYEISNSTELHGRLLSLTTRLMAQVESQLSASGQNPRLTALHLWSVKQYILILMKSGRTDQAKQFLQQAAWLYDSDNQLQALGAFFSQNFATLKTLVFSESSGLASKLLISLYVVHGLKQEVEKAYHNWLQNSVSRCSKVVCLGNLAHFAFQHIMAGEDLDKWTAVFKEAASELLNLDKTCSAVLLMQGVVSLMDQKRFNLAKRSLHQVIDNPRPGSVNHAAELAREKLIAAYREKGDLVALEKLEKEL